jgi:regulator of nucleoside diphosphate kinase
MSPSIVVTTLDAARLSRVLQTFDGPLYTPLTTFLVDELQRATRVEPEEISPDVVTMDSLVRFRLDDDVETRQATLVYPGREDGLVGRISVLSPVGSALIGAREGETVAWKGLDGRRRRLTVVTVLYQPEAHGIDLVDEDAKMRRCEDAKISKSGCIAA